MQRIDDEDLFWMADLDWKAHGPAREGYIGRDMFLAEAAELLGKRICGIWPGLVHFLRMAEYPPPSDIVEADEAFGADEKPIPGIYDREHGVMLAHAVSLDVPLHDADDIDRAEWALIVDKARQQWDDGLGARRAAAGIARAFARLAFEEEIDVHARPFGDKGYVRLGPEFWEVDDEQAIRRLAACALSIDRPYEPAAQPDHRIFVGHNRYARAIDRASRRWYVPVCALDEELKRDEDQTSVRVSEVAHFLAGLMVPANSDWNDERFKDAVQAEFGSGGLGVTYNRAKAKAVAHPDRRYFGTAGRRRIPIA
ncbi:hypothetical protein ACBY01_01415 [Sphingomonas sp. ac-8]|uniref:hypothetical protein n=1 Tax=Sphingomonas sp. ac-8 TaxID=3242977 RepID=UPI003A7F9151